MQITAYIFLFTLTFYFHSTSKGIENASLNSMLFHSSSELSFCNPNLHLVPYHRVFIVELVIRTVF